MTTVFSTLQEHAARYFTDICFLMQVKVLAAKCRPMALNVDLGWRKASGQ